MQEPFSRSSGSLSASYADWLFIFHKAGVRVVGLCPLRGCVCTIQVNNSWLDLQKSPAPEVNLKSTVPYAAHGVLVRTAQGS